MSRSEARTLALALALGAVEMSLAADEKNCIQVIVNGQVESAQVRRRTVRGDAPHWRVGGVAISSRVALRGGSSPVWTSCLANISGRMVETGARKWCDSSASAQRIATSRYHF